MESTESMNNRMNQNNNNNNNEFIEELPTIMI